MVLKSFVQPFKVTNSTNSTSSTTGAITVSGGIGVTGNIQSNGYLGIGGAVGDATYPLNVTGAAKISSYLGVAGAIGSSTNVLNVTGNVNCSGTFNCGKLIKNLQIPTGYYAGFGGIAGSSTFPLYVNGSMQVGYSTMYIGSVAGPGSFNVNNGGNGGIQILGTNDCLGIYFGFSQYSYKIYSGLGCYVNSSFYAGNYFGTSDIRVKKNIEIINDAEALVLIRNIYPKKFKHIIGDDRYKIGFIAQEINEIMPYSIATLHEFIPNINSQAKVTNHLDPTKSIITLINAEFPFNEILVDLIIRTAGADNKEIQIIPLEIINNNSIIVTKLNETELFIYGTRVNDYLTITHNNINATFVSAFQELIRQFEIEQAISDDISNRISLL